METKTELLPCPCCGGKAEMDIEYIGHDAFPMIQCQFCRLKLVWYSKEEGVLIEKWNTRVYPAEVQAAIERDTPKKLIFPTVKKKSEEKEDMPRCPACEKLLGKVAGRTRHTYPCKGGARTIECNLYEWDVQTFCPECGQRLDWSEE